jgi:hypothetical protein
MHPSRGRTHDQEASFPTTSIKDEMERVARRNRKYG